MISAVTGIILSLPCIIWIIEKNVYLFLIFFTNWTLLLEFLTFIISLTNSFKPLLRILLISAWTIGGIVVIIFWLAIYPLTPEGHLPPMWFCILTHGVIHIPTCKMFYDTKPEIFSKDFIYPVVISLAYLFTVVVPLRLIEGKSIYPMLFEDPLNAVLTVLVVLLLLYIFFYIGQRISKKSKVN